jgi:hypothetical protein
VTLHIAVTNVINGDSAGAIYKKMKQRHLNFNAMYERKATDFDLPTFECDELKNPILLLEKYGYIFFNNNEYQIIYSHLSELSSNNILSNPKVLLLAAITYYQMGFYVEGDYYLKKCDSFLNEYTDEEKELLQVSKFSSNYSLGNLDRSTYFEELKGLQANIKGEMNSIFLKLKILFLELHNTNIYEETSFDHIFKKVETIGEDIKKINISEEKKYHYMLEVMSFIHEVGIQHFLKTTARMSIQKRILGEVPYQERLANAKMLMELIIKPQEFLQLVNEYAINAENEYLHAMVIFKKNYMFYSFMFQSLVATYSDGTSIEKFKETHPATLFSQAYRELVTAYNIFSKKMDCNSAYKTLTISIEINYLYSFLYSKNIDNEIYDKILVALNALEKDLCIGKYTIITEEMVTKLVSRRDRSLFDSCYNMPVEEQHQFATMFIRTIGLPVDRIENVIYDIEFMQRANEVVNSKYFDILQNLTHSKNKETLYKEKPCYVIRCINCNYQTVESDNLDTLLAALRVEHNHICM